MTTDSKPGRFLVLLTFLLTAMLGPVSAAVAFTVQTQPAEPGLAGESVELQLKAISGGVGQNPRTLLGPSRGQIGDTIDMGNLKQVPERPTELRVTVPWGSYYRNVSPRALKRGSMTLTLYPASENGNFSVQEHGLLVQPFPGRVMVREYLVINNPTRTLVGGKQDPLTLDLPPGVTTVHPGPGLSGEGDLVAREDHYVYQLAFPPGRSILGFYYMVRTDSNRYTMERSVSRSTRRLTISMPRYSELDVTVKGLNRRTQSDTGGNLRYVATNLAPGDRFQLTLEGLDQVNPAGAMGQGAPGGGGSNASPGGASSESGSRPSSFSTLSWPLILGITVSLLFFLGAYAYVQYSRAQLGKNTVPASFLIEEIARLDQEHEDGAIDDAYYNRTRRRWKEKLTESTDREPSED